MYTITIIRRHLKCCRNRIQWVNPWLAEEQRRVFSVYFHLVLYLKDPNLAVFTNYMRLPPAIYDELVQHLAHHIRDQLPSSIVTWFKGGIDTAVPGYR